MNLNQITVPSLDLATSIPFYQSLGLKLIAHSNDEYARFECENGASFSLHLVSELPSGGGIWFILKLMILTTKLRYCKN